MHKSKMTFRAEEHPFVKCWQVTREYQHPDTGEDALEVVADVYGEHRAARARIFAAASELVELAILVRCRLGGCLRADGSWGELPAATKRELLEAAKAVMTLAGVP